MEIDTYFAGALLVTASSGLAVVGLLMMRRLLRSRDLLSCHDVGGYLLSVVGTLYAVILGLIVVDSMGKFQQARITTEAESSSLANVLILANQLPRANREATQEYALIYINHVINQEWPAMDKGEHSAAALQAATRLIDTVSDFTPTTEKEKAIYTTQLTALCKFWDSRRARTVIAAHGVSPLEWVVLLGGGVVTVSFTYFFKLEHLKIQVIMTIMVSILIALNLFLVLMFGHPFSGEMRVEPDGLRVAKLLITPQSEQGKRPTGQ